MARCMPKLVFAIAPSVGPFRMEVFRRWSETGMVSVVRAKSRQIKHTLRAGLLLGLIQAYRPDERSAPHSLTKTVS